MHDKIEIFYGDIVKLNVDAIVNAANTTLLGGGGVDGAIHRAAGIKLKEECSKLGGCKTGEAKITKGYNLPAKFVIHTVGPVWKDGNHNEDNLLRNCYINSLNLAVDNKISTIAFPSISTGAYGFPFERAAKLAVNTIVEIINRNPTLLKIIFVCFSQNDFLIYKSIFKSYEKSNK